MYRFTFPPTVQQCSFFFTPSPAFIISIYFDDGHSHQCEVIFHCSFDWHFSNKWHHRLNGREFEWTPGVGDGPWGLVCCNSWGHKVSDTTERLNWTELNWIMRNAEHLFMCLLVTCTSSLEKCLFMWTKLFQMHKMDLEKTDEQDIKLSTSVGS